MLSYIRDCGKGIRDLSPNSKSDDESVLTEIQSMRRNSSEL